MNEERVRIVIIGRVQGVFFRSSTRDEALRLGIGGWVRNQNDGSVEIVAEGDREQLDEFIDWCRTGPPDARVDELDTSRSEFLSEFDKFIIKYN